MRPEDAYDPEDAEDAGNVRFFRRERVRTVVRILRIQRS